MNRTGHIELLAAYNQWMNTKVFDSAMQLEDKELAADKGAFFGSILGTLNHILVGDTIWLQRFARHPANYVALETVRNLSKPDSLDQVLFADIRSLKQHRDMIDFTITQWASSIAEIDLDLALQYADMKGQASNRPFFSLLMHFFNHQTHHRGQVTTLLSQAGIDVGETDLLALIPTVDPA